MASNGHPKVLIYCDEASHAPKKPIVGKLKTAGSYGYAGKFQTKERQHLLDEKVVGELEFFGDTATGGSRPPMILSRSIDSYRSRTIVQCRLCGLRLELRQETANQVAAKLLEAGVLRVRLADLAATVGSLRQGIAQQ